MTDYICSNCGNLIKKNDNLSNISSGIWTILKTIIFIAVFIGLWFIPVIGWILAIVMLFIPISAKKENTCPKCKCENCIIPIDTPKGQELYNKYQQKINNQSNQS